MCKVLRVSRNAYYSWRRQEQSEGAVSRKELLKRHIMEVFEESRQIYGSYKICIELNKRGTPISRPYVARLMREMSISSNTRKKFVATTDSRHENPLTGTFESASWGRHGYRILRMSGSKTDGRI